MHMLFEYILRAVAVLKLDVVIFYGGGLLCEKKQMLVLDFAYRRRCDRLPRGRGLASPHTQARHPNFLSLRQHPEGFPRCVNPQLIQEQPKETSRIQETQL